MEALDVLLKRVSVARLAEPAPTAEQRELLFRAAMRAPDHGQLRPWRFLTIEGDGRERLGELFARVVAERDGDMVKPEVLNKARQMPFRAPLVVAVVAHLQAHPKVPELEQMLAVGCAAHGMLLAAYALGIGAMWRTGELAYDPRVAAGLGLEANERVLGFLYLGTPVGDLRIPPEVDASAFVSAWNG